MTPLVPRRVETEELLDLDSTPAADVQRSLGDLRRLNLLARAFHAYRMLIRLLAGNRTASILDLGTGTSELLAPLDHSLRIGLDFKIQHLVFGKRRTGNSEIRRVAADAARLPFRSESMDIVGSSHFFHHFTPEENVSILQEALRVARIGVFVTDTKRHIAPLVAMQLLGALRLLGRVTRHDAPASVRQGYTIPELRAIAQRAGARRFEIVSMFPFRFGLILWK